MSTELKTLLAACPDDCRCKVEAQIEALAAAGFDWRAILIALRPLILQIINQGLDWLLEPNRSSDDRPVG